MKKIFISHASSDEPIVKSIIDDLLVGALSVKISEIFCTTTDGMKIESGEDWRNSIIDALRNSTLTILIITPNYKESEVCICEMGAAWVTSAKVLPFVVEPINYSSVGIIQQPKQVEKLLEEKSLDRLKDIVQSSLNIEPKEIKSDRWTVKKIEFLQKIKKHLKDNPFHHPLSRDEFEKVLKDKSDLESTVQSIISEKLELESLIEEMKKAKDANEIKEIEKKHKKIASIDEFRELCEKITENLSKLSSIVRGIVFVSYSGKNVKVRNQEWEELLDEAISRDYITENLDADWETSKLMRVLYESLNHLNHFIRDKEDDESFQKEYEDSFSAPLSLSNMDFWKEAFNLPISIS